MESGREIQESDRISLLVFSENLRKVQKSQTRAMDPELLENLARASRINLLARHLRRLAYALTTF